ncbi:hypothetical protein PGB90_001069 [Kerria lacca]
MNLDAVCPEQSSLISKEGIKSKHLLMDDVSSTLNSIDDEKVKGVSVIWKNLRVSARIKKENFLSSTTNEYKELIHNVNGCIPPNILVAILGASGSGKSTLMTVLANRQLNDLKISGDILINRKKIQMKYMRQISGFVYQDDLFIPTLTVSEHLHFVAQLKLDCRIAADFRKEIINDLLSNVGLLKCANNFIGNSHYSNKKINLSSGEQKRLSVATELLTDPPLLFCDEPTTGLDSFSALKLMTIMKSMTVQRNKTIVCSIHQPSEQIFNLFNHIILLYNGNIAYCGATQKALQFFQSLGYAYNKDQNPADYLIKSLAIIPGREAETVKVASDICIEFKKSKFAQEINDYIETENKNTGNDYFILSKTKRISWFYRLYLMTYRNCLEIIRDPSIQGTRIIYKVILALIIGFVLMNSVTRTQEGIQNLKGALFALVAENFFPSIYNILDHMPNRIPVFCREYSNNINSPLIFYLSNLFSLFPGFFLDPFLFTVIIYWMIALRPELVSFLATILINILILNCSVAFGIFLSLLTNSHNMAILVSIPIDTMFMIISGTFINLRTLPSIFSWLRYLSWLTYSFEALLILQLQNINYIACESDSKLPCLKTGNEVLTQLDFNSVNLQRNIFLILAICLSLHAAAYCILNIKLYFKMKR